uniref:Uncharacterized protein n=1 Tax=Mycena chlorophos TaxID=658473 RepID=A0ABQ0M039_MYCCL|nr:predicted protein [Mycena chlorophos]
MLRTLLCGCIRLDDALDRDVIPDERRRLLGDGARTQSQPGANEQEQVLVDRLEAIVRGASRKMVNVYSRKPFKLTSGRTLSPDAPSSAGACPRCAANANTNTPLQWQHAPPSPLLLPMSVSVSVSPSARMRPALTPHNTMTMRRSLSSASSAQSQSPEPPFMHVARSSALVHWDTASSSSSSSTPSVSRSSSFRRGHAQGYNGAGARVGSPLGRQSSNYSTGRPEIGNSTRADGDGEGYFALPTGRAGGNATSGPECRCRDLEASTTQTQAPSLLTVREIPLIYSWDEAS